MTQKISAVLRDDDLRVSDQPSFTAAIRAGNPMVAIGMESPSVFRAGHHRRKIVESTGLNLFRSLNQFGIRTLTGAMTDLPSILEQVKPSQIYSQEPIGTEQQSIFEKTVNASHPIQTFRSGDLFEEASLPFSITDTPSIFTQFKKMLESIVNPAPEPGPLPSGLDLGQGEFRARKRFQNYLSADRHIDQYLETRNGLLRETDSSRLSVDLARGILSVRWVWHEILRYEREVVANESTYWLRFELLWREYFRWVAR